MAIRRKCISVPGKVIDSLSQETKTCRATVYNALNFLTDTDKARKIRELAVSKYDGKVVTKYVW